LKVLSVIRTTALVLIAALVTLFFVQNLTATEIAFLTWSLTAPRAVAFLIVFLLGAAVGYLLRALRTRQRSHAATSNALD
jgi:uncharacterized integral membrane protein